MPFSTKKTYCLATVSNQEKHSATPATYLHMKTFKKTSRNIILHIDHAHSRKQLLLVCFTEQMKTSSQQTTALSQMTSILTNRDSSMNTWTYIGVVKQQWKYQQNSIYGTHITENHLILPQIQNMICKIHVHVVFSSSTLLTFKTSATNVHVHTWQFFIFGSVDISDNVHFQQCGHFKHNCQFKH